MDKMLSLRVQRWVLGEQRFIASFHYVCSCNRNITSYKFSVSNKNLIHWGMQSVIKNHLNSWISLTIFASFPAVSATSFQLKKTPTLRTIHLSVLITEPSLYQLVFWIVRYHWTLSDLSLGRRERQESGFWLSDASGLQWTVSSYFTQESKSWDEQ